MIIITTIVRELGEDVSVDMMAAELDTATTQEKLAASIIMENVKRRDEKQEKTVCNHVFMLDYLGHRVRCIHCGIDKPR